MGLAALFVVGVVGWWAGSGEAATSAVVVSADIPSATSLTTTLCQTGQAGRTDLGVVQPGSSVVTSADCEVVFGSSNDSAMLMIGQEDAYGTTMARAGWASRVPGIATAWDAVSAGSPSRAWIVGSGGGMRISNDGGITWAGQNPNASPNSLRDIDATDANTAWTVGDLGTVRRTTDAGVTWTDVDNTLGSTVRLETVTAIDAQRAWVGGAAGIARYTNDGGATWSVVDTCAGSQVRDLHAPTPTVVWATCVNQTAYRSVNGGTTWALVTNPDAGNISRSIWSTGATTAWVGTTSGKVLRTTDSGATWVTQLTSPGTNIDEVTSVDGLSMWAVTDIGSIVYHTTNGGTTWVEEYRVGAPVQFIGLAAADSGRAIGAAWETVGSTGRIYSTPTDPINDYNDPANDDWSTPGAQMFGVCLRTVGGAASTNGTTWPADSDTIGDEAAAAADCSDGDGDPWKAIPAAPVKVARQATPQSPATATAFFRFGMRIPLTQVPGTYRAGILFEVRAPEV